MSTKYQTFKREPEKKNRRTTPDKSPVQHVRKPTTLWTRNSNLHVRDGLFHDLSRRELDGTRRHPLRLLFGVCDPDDGLEVCFRILDAIDERLLHELGRRRVER